MPIGNTSTPLPGTEAANQQGCRCPVMDNHYGRGWGIGKDGNPVFVYVENCPLHGNVVRAEIAKDILK